jgi:ubiquinone/menaquinone biosynthesis C-methylase UbiE
MHGLIHARRRNLPRLFQGRSSRVYDLVARRVARPLYRRLADDIAAVAPAGAEVLDVGTGPGVLLVELARRRPDLRLTGIDLSADMVAAATSNLRPYADRARVRLGDATRLPFPDTSVDLIVSSLSMHHWDDPAAAVPELSRVLRPGGRVRIYDFPFAPFDVLAGAARSLSVLNGHEPRRTRIRSGVPLLPCVRFELSAAPA